MPRFVISKTLELIPTTDYDIIVAWFVLDIIRLYDQRLWHIILVIYIAMCFAVLQIVAQ